jgi:hypothetical protein
MLFWVTLVSDVAIILGATIIALLDASRVWLLWIRFVDAIAGLPLLVGVFLVTRPMPYDMSVRGADGLRRALRLIAMLAVLGELIRYEATAAGTWPAMPCAWTCKSLIVSIAILLLYLYLARLATRFDEANLSRSLVLIAWIAAIANVTIIFSIARIYEVAGMTRFTFYALSGTRRLFALVVWIWALRLLWNFGKRITAATEGRCFNCGYRLEGLQSHRCRECGAAFAISDPKLSGSL